MSGSNILQILQECRVLVQQAANTLEPSDNVYEIWKFKNALLRAQALLFLIPNESENASLGISLLHSITNVSRCLHEISINKHVQMFSQRNDAASANSDCKTSGDITTDFSFSHPTRVVTYEDIVGSSVVIQSLRENVVYQFILPDFIKREIFSGIRKGAGDILLYGPPGCGKNLIAMATATEADSVFISISPSDILSKYQGESERYVKRLFEHAYRYSSHSILAHLCITQRVLV